MAVDRFEAIQEHDGAITGTPTGYADLDGILGGLQPSTLTILGARPSMGKTSLALSIAAAAAIATNRRVLFFSPEMSFLELTQRVLVAEARVNTDRLRFGRLTDAEWSRIHVAVGRLAGAPLWIDDTPSISVFDVRARSRRKHAEYGGLALIVVDYLQLMASSGVAENRQIDVSQTSRGLKVLARELDCPVLALSQLSRKNEERADKRPLLSDLRDSGAIEQDADVVLFLYRDEMYNPDTPAKNIAEVIVSKNRGGPNGVIRLNFQAKYTRFEGIEMRSPEPGVDF